MTRSQWQRVETVVTRALGLPLAERKRFIESAVVDPAIQQELIDVLRAVAGRALDRFAAPHGGPGAPSAPRKTGDQPGSASWLVGDPAQAASSQSTPAPSSPSAPPLHSAQALMDGRFILVRQIGRGGMGEVYLAQDTKFGILVALKVLLPQLVDDPQARSRVMLEASRARLCSSHPHVVPLYEVFDEDVGGQLLTVLVMDYVEGKPASRYVDEGPVEIRRAVRWAREVASAVAHAHDHSVLHCDLKPANILITFDDRAKVLDFGIARATFEPTDAAAPLRGTLQYMAPEQLVAGEFSPAGDIYSLGVTLFELLTGRRPFDGDPGLLPVQILVSAPPKLSEVMADAPPPLDAIIERTLEKDPDRRFRSARALERALAAVEEQLTGSLSQMPAPPASTTAEYVAWGVGAFVALTVLGFVSSTALDAGLDRSAAFRSETPLMWPIWGLRSLIPSAVLIGLSLAALTFVISIARLLTRSGPFAPIGRGIRALQHRVASMPTAAVSQLLLALNVAALAAFVWYFWPLLAALERFGSGGDLAGIAPLNPERYAWLHNRYGQVMTAGLALFGAGWALVLRQRRRRHDREGGPVLTSGAVILGVALILHALPYRVIYHNESEQVEYAGMTCYLVGRQADEGLVFCPLALDRSRTVRLDDPALVRTGRIDNIFRPLSRRAPAQSSSAR